MRTSRAVATLLAVAMVVGTLTVAIGAVQPAQAQSEEQSSQSSEDRRLEVVIVNRGPTDFGGEIDVSAKLVREDTTMVNETLDVPAGENWTKRFDDAPAGDHVLTVNVTSESEDLFRSDSSWVIPFRFETGNCPGRYKAQIAISAEQENGGVVGEAGTVNGENGCYAAPPGFDDALDEARSVIDDPPSGDAIDVPTPRLGDVGTFEYRDGSPESKVDVHTSTAFEVGIAERFPGQWGHPVDAVEVRTETRYHDADLIHDEGDTSIGAYMYRRPSMTPFVTPSGESGGSGGHSSLIQEGRHREEADHLAYVDSGTFQGCRWRFQLQDETISEGEEVPMSRLCHGTYDFNATYTAGSVVETDGVRAIPLYRVEDGDTRTTVQQIWLADDVPYVIATQSYTAGDGTQNWASSKRLTTYDAGDEALPEGQVIRTEPPEMPLSDVDPLTGPSAGELSLPYSLQEASEDAQRDPSLTGLQQLLMDDEAVLAGATYRVRHDVQDGGVDADRLTWYLVYTAPGQDPVHVECERRRGSTDDRTEIAPAGDCDELDRSPSYADRLYDPPSLGRDDLPDQGASLGDAEDRWRRATPGSGEDVNYVLYRAWGESHTGDGSFSPEGPPIVSVGTALPLDNEVLPSEREKDFSRFDVDLTSGRSQRIHIGSAWRSSTLLGQADDSPSLDGSYLGVDRRQASDEQIPAFVAGAGAGAAALGIVGLLWYYLGGGKAVIATLYTRLKGEEVLDHEIRQSMVDLVEDEPGIHAHAIGEELDVAHGQTRHHLRLLVREGQLAEVETGGYRRYFPKGRYDHGRMRAMAALRNGQNEKAFRVIRDNPGIGVSDLADAADVSTSYASKMVDELSEVGIVDKVRDGRRVSLYAAER